jgi:predicted alpha/beta-fold hydrolase
VEAAEFGMTLDLGRLSGKTRRCFEQRPFCPHPALWNGHLQTIVASQQRRKFDWGWQTCVTKSVRLSEGAVVRAEVVFCDESSPTLVAVHGMGGSADSMYMLGLSHKAYLQGWNSVRLSLYNLNPELERPKVFHAGCSEDLGEIASQLFTHFGFEKCFFVGVSLGGNILLKLLGEWGDDHPWQLLAAATISPLVDLTASWQILDSKSNFLYRWYYVSRLRRLALRRADALASYVDIEKLGNVTTIREFDEAFTVPLSGYKDVFEYYREASAASGLRQIRVPTLLIHSRDDPLLPWRPLASSSVEQNPYLMLALSERGGHAAFVEGVRQDIDRSWAENRILEFFRLLS